MELLANSLGYVKINDVEGTTERSFYLPAKRRAYVNCAVPSTRSARVEKFAGYIIKESATLV
jgi:hypothetical protein